MIPRSLTDQLRAQLIADHRAILIFGARQVGKTTLVNEVLRGTSYKVLQISGDEALPNRALSSRDARELRGLVSGYDVIFIDEAQRIPEIGINIKILIDQFPDLRVIATGSSSLDLASKTRESLAGRSWVYRLFPIAMSELALGHTPFELNQMLEDRLIYGSYPSVFGFLNIEDRKNYLRGLLDSYLYKDILDFKGIRYAAQIRDLLRLLAFQIGQEISLTELGTQLGMSKDTVESYIDLLEQSHVVFRLRGFNRNLRKEVRKQSKVYFCDMGIRNALIENFNLLNQRVDIGAIWENFVISERLKHLSYSGGTRNVYFWRTHTGAELDFVEEADGKLHGYEIKWNPSAKAKPPLSFLETYPDSDFALIHRNQYLAFVTNIKNL